MLNTLKRLHFGTHIVLTVPVLLSACAVGPDYKRPEMDILANWNELSVQEQSAITTNKTWWTDFKDNMLNSLIEKGIAENKDLKIAEARIAEARGSRMSAASSLYPQINASGQAQRGNPSLTSQNKTLDIYDGRFDASWEIDLFGGNRRKVEASDALIEASSAQYQGVTISLVAETVREYITLRELQDRYAVMQDMVEAQKRLVELNNVRFEHGAASSVDVSQEQTAYKTTLANLSVFEREITASIYRLSVLTGSENDEVVELLKPSGHIPVIIYAPAMDAPASVLSRRPDVMQAEDFLQARTALTGIAISDLYPKISIGGFFGWQNTSLLPSQNIWSLATGAFMPLLNFGKIQGNIDAASAREQQAYHAYRKAVIEAVADVETKLSDYAKNKNRTESLREALESSEKTLKSTENQFGKGAVPLQSVLAAKINTLQSRDAYLNALAEEMKSVASLQKSMGL